MFNKILIANRGEIALRIIRACHELGIKTVAVYSTADKLSLHVKFANEAVCIGPGPSAESYLNIPRIIAAGEITNSDAIHPGYGFLAESADFSRICHDNGFVFIGPTPEIINSMGDKAQAKETMSNAGVPVIPGSNGLLSSPSEALKLAEEVVYPVMLKATAGGGGKGIRKVENRDEMEKLYTAAQTEAITSFGNGDLYLEKFIEKPRHIEIQIIGDTHGNVAHLGGTPLPGIVPFDPNHEMVGAFQFDPKLDIDRETERMAERKVGSELSSTLLSAWSDAEEAILAYPNAIPLYSMYGFVWYRLWARPFVPNIEAIPESERAYYQEFMCTTPHNPNNVDLSRDVLFHLTTLD